MKKVLVVLLMTCLLALSAQAVYADVISETNNDFYLKYREYIIPLDREFIADGEAGHVAAMDAPGAGKETGTIENGEYLYVEYSCLYDGEYWGLTYAYGYAWVRMAELLVLYDDIAFREEFADEIYPYEGDLEAVYQAGAAVLWAWPGSGVVFFEFDMSRGDGTWVPYAYIDEHGLEWGLLNYYGRSAWICISDPMNRDLPVREPMPGPAKWVSETEHVDISTIPGNDIINRNNAPVFIAVLVAAVVIGTILLIRRFFKPN